MLIRTIVLGLLVVVLGGALWQHHRYLRVRRDVVGDRQPLLYPGRTFHALTFVKVGVGKPVIDEVRALAKDSIALDRRTFLMAHRAGVSILQSTVPVVRRW